MSAVTRYFCEPVYFPRSAWSVVGWWESRRPTYNVAVGAAGLVTTTFLLAVGAHPPLRAIPILIGVYAIGANLCYSLGAIVDLIARRIGGPSWAIVGPTVFRYGFVFSIGLTLLPIPVAAVVGALHLVGVIP